MQVCEMDVYICYQGSCNKEVNVPYWASEFLGHATNKYLECECDGPNVNWKFYEHTVSEKEGDLPPLMNSRSCNLHVVNVTFKIGAESTDWKLKKILKACFTILYNTPTIRDDFVSQFQQNFPCSSTRYAFLISWMIFDLCMILCDVGGWQSNTLFDSYQN